MTNTNQICFELVLHPSVYQFHQPTHSSLSCQCNSYSNSTNHMQFKYTYILKHRYTQCNNCVNV